MSSKPFQTTSDFADALDAYGSDLERWPEELRREGATMLERSNEARKLLREARVVHRVLSERLTVSTDTHLVNAILQRKSELDMSPGRLSADQARKDAAAVRSDLVRKGIAAAILVGGGLLAGTTLHVEPRAVDNQSAMLSDLASYAEAFYL